MRDQAVIAELLDVNVAVNNEDTYLANVDSVALFNKDLVAIVIGRLHTVAANRDDKICLLCLCTFGNEQILRQIAVKDVSRRLGCFFTAFDSPLFLTPLKALALRRSAGLVLLRKSD